MKNFRKHAIILLLFTLTFSCQKDKQQPPQTEFIKGTKENPLTIEQAKAWLDTQPNTYLNEYPIRWQNAKIIPIKTGSRIAVYIPGQPTFQKIKQGYRQLSIQKDSNTKEITAAILEIIPDAIYFQKKQKVSPEDFTGRILEYNLDYHLQQGKIYSDGKPIGEIRPATAEQKKSYTDKASKNNTGSLTPLNFNFEQTARPAGPAKTAYAQVIQNCYWLEYSYMDAEGIFNIYTERICNTYIYDDGGGYNDAGNYHNPPGYENGNNGGGGSSNNTNTAPAPSNLPGEESQNIDPKKMTKCFSTIPDQGAAFQVKILVQEPLPGTSFNIGPNSFGHVAIQLTKVKGDQSITQVLGFYPTGTGLSKLVSNSTMKDNSDLEYTMASNYFTDAENFQKIINFVSNPPKGYHFTDYNCASFAYYAAQAGGLSVPNPTTQIGFAGPGGAGTAMTPAGMATALRAQKAANPNANITSGGGTAPASKGECNEE